MEKRYNALRIIGTIFKVLGVMVGILTLLALLATCAASFFGGAAIEQVGRDLGQLVQWLLHQKRMQHR